MSIIPVFPDHYLIFALLFRFVVCLFPLLASDWTMRGKTCATAFWSQFYPKWVSSVFWCFLSRTSPAHIYLSLTIFIPLKSLLILSLVNTRCINIPLFSAHYSIFAPLFSTLLTFPFRSRPSRAAAAESEDSWGVVEQSHSSKFQHQALFTIPQF